MHYDSRPRTDPFIDQAECSVSFKWDRKQRSKRCQANEGEENMPYEPDRVTAVKRFLDPAFGAGLARHAVVDGVQEYVAVDQDHELASCRGPACAGDPRSLALQPLRGRGRS